MKPPAPKPLSWLSVTNEVSTAQIAASTALPPSRRTCAPASAVSGWPAATTPLAAGMGRSVSARYPYGMVSGLWQKFEAVNAVPVEGLTATSASSSIPSSVIGIERCVPPGSVMSAVTCTGPDV